MAQAPKYRINQLAKDMNLKSKDIIDCLDESVREGKTHMTVLEPGEFSLFFDAITKQNQITDLDAYLNGKLVIKPKKAPAKSEKAKADVKEESEKSAAKEEKAPAKKKAAASEAAPVPEKESAPVPEIKAEVKEEPKTEVKAEPAPVEVKKHAETKPEVKPEVKAEEPAKTPDIMDDYDYDDDDGDYSKQRRDKEKVKRDNRRTVSNTLPDYIAEEPEKEVRRDNTNRQNDRGDRGNDRGNDRFSNQQGRPNDRFGNQQGRPNDRFNNQQGRPNDRFNNQQGRPNDRFNNQQGRPNDRFSNQQGRPNDRFNNQQNRPNDRFSNQQAQPQTPVQPQEPVQINFANAQTAPKQKVKNAAPQPEGRKRTGATRVVDTRTSSVDLSKYDEHLESFVSNTMNEMRGDKQKLNKRNNNDPHGKNKAKERMAMEKLKKENLEKAKKMPLQITVPDEISVGELASRLKATSADIIKRLMKMGVMATVNQTVDFDTAYLIADEMGAKVTREVVVTIEERLFDEAEDSEEALVERSPVVCVMGHVDHGKTSLLDAIRHTSVTSGEAGGITQHIGAYRVSINGKDITFLDTPGHEAFTAMRARGAQATDIAILVVAADDGIMPQTVEAINHAKAAGIDIIVAINKMDKPTANPDNVMQELTKYELVPEEWGGDVMCVPVSALTRMGIDDLLEDILLIAEIKELKANPNRRAKGIVIESKLDKGRGPIATVLVQNGTLHSGDIVIAGTSVGRVRAMTNDRGQIIKEAGPSVPVEIIGLSEVPTAGDEFGAVQDERMARELAEQRREKAREEVFKANSKVNLDDLFAQIGDGVKDLNIIVKADVDGSVEAVKQSLEKLSNDEVKVKVIHGAAGGIREGDVTFAAASNAIIVGFNVRPDKAALDSAERQNVDVRTYRVIYDCINEITAAMKGMLAPQYKEVLLGHAEVRQTIRVPNVGTIAGSYIQDGKISRNAQIRVIRDGIVIFEDKISSLKRFKDDAREVAAGYECGVGLEKFNDIREGDVLEAFVMEEVER